MHPDDNFWTLEQVAAEKADLWAWARPQWKPQLRFALENGAFGAALFTAFAWAGSFFMPMGSPYFLVQVAGYSFAFFFAYVLLDFLWYLKARFGALRRLAKRIRAGDCVQRPDPDQHRKTRGF